MISVLLIDEEGLVRETIIRALKVPDVTTVAAPTFSAGNELLQNQIFDVVLIDLMLPDGNAIDLTRQLRKHGTSSKIIVLSDLDEPAYRTAALAAGADDFICKKVPDQELLACIRS